MLPIASNDCAARRDQARIRLEFIELQRVRLFGYMAKGTYSPGRYDERSFATRREDAPGADPPAGLLLEAR